MTQLSELFGCPFTDLNDWLAQVTPSAVTSRQEQLDPKPADDAHPTQQANAQSAQQQSQNIRPQSDSQTDRQTQTQSGASLESIPETATCQQTANGAQEAQPTATPSLLTGTGSQLASHQLVSLAAFAAAAAGQVSMHVCWASSKLCRLLSLVVRQGHRSVSVQVYAFLGRKQLIVERVDNDICPPLAFQMVWLLVSHLVASSSRIVH